MQHFFLDLSKAVGIQMLGLFGLFFTFGFVLSKLQEWTQRNYVRSIGWKGILWTAWIGTPIHEIGHIFFALIFGHKINHISLFNPNEDTGGLGQVDHSFHKYSLYQRIGNFFIGSAPLIFGSVILVMMLYFMIPNGKEIFLPLTDNVTSFSTFFDSLLRTFTGLFTLENFKTWNFWLFIYLSFCIASHLAPSKQDRKGMWGGFFWIILILIFVNAGALLFHANITNHILKTSQYFGIFTAVFSYALIISLLHWLISVVILTPFRK